MKKTITLTMNADPIIIDSEHIVAVLDYTGGTLIYLSGGDKVMVDQSYENVLNKINDMQEKAKND